MHRTSASTTLLARRSQVLQVWTSCTDSVIDKRYFRPVSNARAVDSKAEQKGWPRQAGHGRRRSAHTRRSSASGPLRLLARPLCCCSCLLRDRSLLVVWLQSSSARPARGPIGWATRAATTSSSPRQPARHVAMRRRVPSTSLVSHTCMVRSRHPGAWLQSTCMGPTIFLLPACRRAVRQMALRQPSKWPLLRKAAHPAPRRTAGMLRRGRGRLWMRARRMSSPQAAAWCSGTTLWCCCWRPRRRRCRA